MTSVPTIALSAKWSAPPGRFRWLADHGFALDYAPNPAAFETLPGHVDTFLAAGIPVRYHGFFPAHEFAHRDPGRAADGLRVHLAALDAMAGRGEPVITFHIGLRQPDQIDAGRAVENLSRLVEYARPRGITICLENLRTGPTSHAQTLAAWARASGAMITFDAGHAVSCAPVQLGELSPLDFLDLVADRLRQVHIYERETDRHHPPRDMTVLAPIVDRLLATPCRWWTIELEDEAEALATRTLLLAYLDSKPATSP
jgi:sugar phosphate isomerase/epimerase